MDRLGIQTQQDILKIQEEKSGLEQLILEILSFGEQCDQQFDKLQQNYRKFEAQDNDEHEH